MINRKLFFVSLTTSGLLGAAVALGRQPLAATPPITQQLVATSPETSIQLAQLQDTTPAHTNNFVHAAQIATPAVVHIKAKYKAKVSQTPGNGTPFDQLLKEFFEKFDLPHEQQLQPKQTAGSGVILSQDGYIVTNYHVIRDADEVEVTLDDNRRYIATIIGQDPDTDLALLKIKEKSLTFLKFGDSDQLQVGEDVLAVGNPFNLNSTVTKGIVSAKGRAINLTQNNGKLRIEAFIQTDAAVNPGNSGGALVNLQGELVGINTAILAPTGSFTGYSFAIPSSIVAKVFTDLKKYGIVQRAMLGINIQNVDADLAAEKGLQQLSGIYVIKVNPGSAAETAGLQAGDVIVAISGKKVKNTSQLQEQIARYKPQDKIRVTLYRKNKEKTLTVTLKNAAETIRIVAHKDSIEVAGAAFKNIDEATQKELDISGGVCISKLGESPWKKAGIRKGAIITAIDKHPVQNTKQLAQLLSSQKEGILVEVCLRKGVRAYYAVDLGSTQKK